MRNVLSYEKSHPNPHFYRKNWKSLNGNWKFLFDADDSGLKKEYPNREPNGTLTIKVPYAYETEKSGIVDKRVCFIIWYWKKISRPAWNQRIILHFDRCDYFFEGWIDGLFIGNHQGGYDAFSFDITDFLHGQNNLVAIRVYDDKNPAHLRGKQTWKEGPFECFYRTTTGIYGDVWLEEVATTHLTSFQTRFQKEKNILRFEIKAEATNENNIVSVSVSFEGKNLGETQGHFKDGKAFASLVFDPQDLHLWSVDNPALYDVKLNLENGNKTIDSVLSYFGINNVEISSQGIVLNGKKTVLKFVLDQGYFPGSDLTGFEKDYVKDIQLVKKMGFNGVRKHQKVETELFHYLADREGLLTSLEMPSPHKYDLKEEKTIKQQWERILKEHKGHPSLISLVCFNESWGVQEIKENQTEQAFANSLYAISHHVFPSIPVISNDGWEHTQSDLLTFHDYEETSFDFFKTYQAFKDLKGKKGNGPANAERKAFANGYHYENQPLYLDEFAGIVLLKDEKKGWGYHSADSEDAFIAKYADQLSGIKELGFAGYCATQLTDVFQEKNGFVDSSRHPKVSMKRIKKLNEGF